MKKSNEIQSKPFDKSEEIFLTADEIKKIGSRLYDALEIMEAQGRVYELVLEELDELAVLLTAIADEEGIAERRKTSKFLASTKS